MPLKKKIYRLQFIDDLINRKATGNVETLAKKLNLFRSQTLEHIREMKELGFPLKFCRSSNSYVYSRPGKLVHQLFETELSNDEMRSVLGGKNLFPFFPESDYTGLWVGSFV